MAWTIPSRPVEGNTAWTATQETIWQSLKTFVDGLETTANASRNWWPNVWCLPGVQLRDSTSNESTTLNVNYVDAFKVDAPATVNGIVILVQTAGTGSARLGIWKKDSTGDTWTLVNDAGTVSIASTGEKSLTGLSIALTTPGIYGASVLPQSTITQTTKPSDSSLQGLGSNSPFNTNMSTHISGAQTYGALPSTMTMSPQGSFGNAFHRVLVRLS
jgi:hypothetical protein